MSFVADLRDAILSALKSPGLGPTRYTIRESLMKPLRQKQRCPALRAI